MKLTKLKPLTEKEELERAFPNLKDITVKIFSDTSGNIIYVITTDKKLIAWLKEKGFFEDKE